MRRLSHEKTRRGKCHLLLSSSSSLLHLLSTILKAPARNISSLLVMMRCLHTPRERERERDVFSSTRMYSSTHPPLFTLVHLMERWCVCLRESHSSFYPLIFNYFLKTSTTYPTCLRKKAHQDLKRRVVRSGRRR